MEVIDKSPNLQFYSERNSVDVYDHATELFEEPEVQLTPEQQAEVYDFAKAVYDGEYKQAKRECNQNLEDLNGMSPGAVIQEFHLGYFATPEGKHDLIKMGIPEGPANSIKTGLTDIEKIKATVDTETRKRIAKNSLDWYKGLLVEALSADPELDEAHLHDEPIRVNYEPQKLLDKLSYLAEHRKFYRQVKAGTGISNEDDTSVARAKQLELELNMARANNMTAELYSAALDLGMQLGEAESNPQTQEWMRQLEAITPIIYRALVRNRTEARQSLHSFQKSLARRTDFLLRGIALTDDGQISSISPELIEFVVQVTSENARAIGHAEQRVDENQIAKLKEIKWNAGQFKEFCETILTEWGILSEHQVDWSEAAERDGRAEDDKWQIIVDPQTDSLAIDRGKKIYQIPESFNRTLIATLPVAAHELAHLVQAESDTVLSERIPLAAAGGRRISTLREGGAVDQETKVYAMLGKERPSRAGYLRALQVKIAGGTKVQVARAFYKAYEDESKLTEAEKEENRKIAADRALRLYRNGGYNSQPLEYIEGELSRRALLAHSPEAVEAIMLTGCAFSLIDSVRLHRLGLYNPPQTTNVHPAEDVWRTFSERYLPSIMSDN